MTTHYQGKSPSIPSSAWIAPSADVMGDLTLGEQCSIWFNATVRGDMASITIGENTNVQDNAVVHVNTGMPTSIGSGVTIGHGAIIHGCTIGDECLVGMGAIILDEAVIGEQSIVAAGALVTPRKQFPPRSLIVGSPAKAVRGLTEEEIEGIRTNAKHYIEMVEHYR